MASICLPADLRVKIMAVWEVILYILVFLFTLYNKLAIMFGKQF